MPYATYEQLEDVKDRLQRVWDELNERITFMEASQQGQIDAITVELTTVAGDIVNTQAKLQAEIDALSAANPGVNLSGLQGVADGLDPAVQKLAALAPTPPAPPPPPAAA
jgi:hypothetical protein